MKTTKKTESEIENEYLSRKRPQNSSFQKMTVLSDKYFKSQLLFFSPERDSKTNFLMLLSDKYFKSQLVFFIPERIPRTNYLCASIVSSRSAMSFLISCYSRLDHPPCIRDFFRGNKAHDHAF